MSRQTGFRSINERVSKEGILELHRADGSKVTLNSTEVRELVEYFSRLDPDQEIYVADEEGAEKPSPQTFPTPPGTTSSELSEMFPTPLIQ